MQMNLEKLLREQIDKLNPRHSENRELIRQLLDYWANLRDYEINNRLLQDLVSKYALSEKKLKNLNQQLIEKQQHIDADLAAAAQIQKSLLPRISIPVENCQVAWNFKPCDLMGGDIFNVFRLDMDHWGLYMMDVSGHGVPAAMITVSVSQFLQQFIGQRQNIAPECLPQNGIASPREIFDLLEREFPFERFKNFFTITYMVLNVRNGNLIYSNAGHPYPIIIRENGTFELLMKGGPILGFVDFQRLSKKEKRFKEGQVQLKPGDKLFVYTDGIIEYEQGDGRFYGTDRFYNDLDCLKEKSVKNIVRKAFDNLMAFGGNAKPPDDITLLGLEYNHSSAA